MKKCAILWSVVLLVLSACANIQPTRTTIAGEYHYAVVLEQQAAGMFSHPCNLEQDALKDLMAQLVYKGETGLVSQETKLPVFQPDEIERLAPALQKALEQAASDQRVRFVSFGQKQGVLFNNSRKTEGVVFVAPDRQINMAFSFINAKRAPGETSAMYHQYAKIDPLVVDDSKTPLVADKSGLQLKAFADGRKAPMWLMVDMESFQNHLGENEHYVAVPEKKTGFSLPLNAPSRSQQGTNISSVPLSNQQKQQTVKDKLVFLKNLFDDGLISEKEYQQEKAKVLSLMH